MSAEFRSPFEQVFNFIPQGHEKAIKQSIYNMVALCSVFLGVAAAVAVYLILHPFIKPLVWAVLIGSVLHPAKKTASNLMRDLLKKLIDRQIPLLGGLVYMPFKTVDTVTDAGLTVIRRNLKVLAIVGIGGISVVFLYSYVPLRMLFICKESLMSVFETLNQFASYLTLTMLLVTSASLIVTLLWAAQRPAGVSVTFWKAASHCLWFLLTCYAVKFTGSLEPLLVPVVSICFFISMLVIIAKDTILEHESVEESGKVVHTRTEEILVENESKEANAKPLEELQLQNEPVKLEPSERNLDLHQTPRATTKASKSLNSQKGNQESWSSIYFVIWACVLIQLYRHPSLLHFVPFLVLCYILKKTLCVLYNWHVVQEYCSRLSDGCSWLSEQREVLVPPPVYHVLKIIWRVDRGIVSGVLSQIDSIVTAGVLLVVLGLGTMVVFILGVQLYAESVHMVQVTAGLANSTLAMYPEAQHILPKGIDSMMEQVVDNAYVYGREGITTIIRSLVKEENANTAQLEEQALQLWDRIYQSWLASHGTPTLTTEDKVPASAIISSVGNILENLKKTSDFGLGKTSNRTQKPPLLRRVSSELFNVTFLVEFAKENVGTAMSVVDSLWTIAKANVNIIFNIVTTIITTIAGGGTAILNFVINRIIFLTALFYLLAASGNKYKPVELISTVGPVTGLTLGVAIEEAVNTVCLASMKMALFYGLWTWLNHTVFQAGLVIMPSVLAALLSAVPVLGHYWAALPAAIELWLVQDRATDALLLVVFQILPIMYVDTAIYSEIKGGGHPYLTGLSIAGGILCFGIEGAIFGPLLLCCLLVAIRVYSSVVAESPINPFRSGQRRLVRLDTVG